MKNNKLILGTVQMGLTYGINNTKGKLSKEESFEILAKAYQSDIHYLDTAEAYGDAHKVIGDFHIRYPDMEFQIITKLPANVSDLDIKAKVQEYLNELNIMKLNTLMFHSFDTYRSYKSQISSLSDLKNEGMFDYLGVSVYTNAQAEEVINDKNIHLIQLPFNLLDNRTHRGEIIKKAKESGKIVHTRSAFLQGLFFKDITDIKNPIVKALKDQLNQINSVILGSKNSIWELALGYCLQQNDIDKVIIGVDSIEQLNKNIEAQNYRIDDEMIHLIDKIHTDDLNLLNPSLWN